MLRVFALLADRLDIAAKSCPDGALYFRDQGSRLGRCEQNALGRGAANIDGDMAIETADGEFAHAGR